MLKSNLIKLIVLIIGLIISQANCVLAKVDTILEIPMVGKKESLNVSVAAGIALFRILSI